MTEPNTIFNDEKLLEMYAALPQNLKDAMFSVDVADKIMKSGKKFGLNIEQTGKLAEAAGMVMLGALHPRSFIQTLETDLSIDRAKATDIAKEINHEIFFPIREALKRIHGMEDTQEVTGEKEIEKGDILKKLAEMRERSSGVQSSVPQPAKPEIIPPPASAAPKISETIAPRENVAVAGSVKTTTQKSLEEQFKNPNASLLENAATPNTKPVEKNPIPAPPVPDLQQKNREGLLQELSKIQLPPQKTPPAPSWTEKNPEPKKIPDWAQPKQPEAPATSAQQQAMSRPAPAEIPKTSMQEIKAKPTTPQPIELKKESSTDPYREPIE